MGNIASLEMNLLRPTFLATSLALLVSGCGPQPDAATNQAPGQAVQVTAAPAEVRTVWDEEDVVGNVEAAQRAVLSAKVTGVIDAIKVAPGAKVSRGDVLATIDAREIKARLDQAVAAQEQAQKDFGRIERLLQSGSSTRQEFDAANTRLRTADAALVEARTMLQYTSITAPFDGIITRKLVEVGDLATPGKPLLEMENSSLLRFVAEVPEALIERVQMDAVLPVHVDAAGSSLDARVSEIAPSASAGSRTFLVKLDLPADPKLRAGQFGRLRLPVQERPAVMVPQTALVRRGQVESVFVINDGIARLRLVKSGRLLDSQVEILSGLSGGEIIIINDPALLSDGTAVEVAP
jgi:RND family efflux transporter MFP subunit